MTGIRAVMRKEAREILRDPVTLGVALALPVIMLFLFAYGLNLDVTHISTAVLDRDRSPESAAFVDRFTNSGYFDVTAVVTRYDDVRRLMDAGRISAAIVIPPDFSRHLAGAQPAPVQLIVDGSYPPAARVALAYADAIGRVATGEVLTTTAARMGMAPVLAVDVEPRVWYNPELASKNFLVPGLIAVLLLAFPPMLSTLAIVRERETGSIQQVLVSPLRPWEFVIGKLVPYAAIAFIELLLVLLAGLVWFRVPLRGDLALLLGISLIYVLAAVGIGLLVSTVTRSQVVAMLLTLVLTFMPSFLFSGFIFPLFTMPKAMQLYTYLFPARFYMEIDRGILLKGVGLGALWPSAAMLLAYTAAVLAVASARARHLR